uniref:ATP-dependent RNA helicase n=1 Tax=Micromonas pusilla TaxID=38833 RepID=A0A7R9Y5F4_MICPS|mmetsp:Transcript_6989/g.25709  ORF Transcript_6989/g.25709 Transcript_6989/m.25709 type:complete len:527 (+) Transcript_6989:165-1745(+)
MSWFNSPVSLLDLGENETTHLRGIHNKFRSVLQVSGLDQVLTVQSATWLATGGGMCFDCDICVRGPTGSGKTLAYALPLLQALASRPGLREQRALIVIPTLDLATQVSQLLSPLCDATGLTVGVPLRTHQDKCLVDRLTLENLASLNRPSHAALILQPVDHKIVRARIRQATDFSNAIPLDSASEERFDVMVATPGRLVAHVKEVYYQLLSGLEFLVIDEADRVLRQSYQGCISLIDSGVGARSPHTGNGDRSVSSRRLRKLLISATLTHDSVRFAHLHLNSPRVIQSSAYESDSLCDSQYVIPSDLDENFIVTEAIKKPLALCALLKRIGRVPVIVFTSSVAITHRLFLLLDSIKGLPSSAVEYSSSFSQGVRSAALDSFRSGSKQLLVASDAATRGLDIKHVAAVISYDVPLHQNTYIHRVGRTARAGQKGTAYTICRSSETQRFRNILTKVDGQRKGRAYTQIVLSEEETQEFAGKLRSAIVAAKLTLEAEGIQRVVNIETPTTHAVRVATAQACHNLCKVEL